MCGITACVGTSDALPRLLTCLRNLEYRGYDSAGVALVTGTGLAVEKSEGTVDDLETMLAGRQQGGRVGIGHTRWSTHGKPSDANAHPHTDCEGRLAVVHNGIIENHERLRAALTDRGHTFTSETDTEVVPHLVEEGVAAGLDPATAFRTALDTLEGSYAIAMVVEDTGRVFGTRQGSPLVVGLADDANYLASDIPAFIERTDRVVYLEDGDVVELTASGVRITDGEGRAVERAIETVEWEAEAAEKGGFDHFMLKEIHEQPDAIQRAIEGRIQGDEVVFEEFPPGSFADVGRVHLVGCGTSYHAGLYGEGLFGEWGVPARTDLASEYALSPPPIDEETLVVGVTQSGETADTLEALETARNQGARTLALTNTVASSAARRCDEALFIRAGPEIGVAATKTFSSQVATILLLASRIVADVTGDRTPDQSRRLAALAALPTHVNSLLDSTAAAVTVGKFLDSESHFFIGRGRAFPVALEGALTFKEITYEHAEGFAAGELKHGPLSLVTERTPVFAIATGTGQAKLVSSVEEVQTRGGPVVAVAPRTATMVIDAVDHVLPVPGTHPDLVPVLANVQLQLLAYHTASALDRSIDKPRNLAKSVTVE